VTLGYQESGEKVDDTWFVVNDQQGAHDVPRLFLLFAAGAGPQTITCQHLCA
jgi:hypothetical protein